MQIRNLELRGRYLTALIGYNEAGGYMQMSVVANEGNRHLYEYEDEVVCAAAEEMSEVVDGMLEDLEELRRVIRGGIYVTIPSGNMDCPSYSNDFDAEARRLGANNEEDDF